MRWPSFRTETLPDAGPLYAATVAAMRRPDWFRSAGVPDTIDGRFAVLATLLALAVLRLEAGGADARALSARLVERFVDDMEVQLREGGTGDPTLGKKVRKLVASLARRTDSWRGVEAPSDALLTDSLNAGAGQPNLGEARRLVLEWRERLAAAGDDDLLSGLA